MATASSVPAGTASPEPFGPAAGHVAAVHAEGAPQEATAPAPHPTTLKLQVLTTEHWSLLASRGLAWNEAFSRAGMYLSTLSGAIVALGLVAGIDGFDDVFTVFALVILPLVLFVGIATHVRMGAANYHDAMTVYGMNRIRGAYAELLPGIDEYFVMSAHDDQPGIAVTMAVPPNRSQLVHLISATPFLIVVLNGAVAGAIAGVAAGGLARLPTGPTIALAAGVGIASVLVQARLAATGMLRLRALVRPRFPSPEPGGPGESPPPAS